MVENLKWKVLRRHEGDRMYEEGEIREGTQADLGHLAPKVLELVVEVKAEPAPLNKAEPAPANKAKAPRKGKGK